MASAGKIITVLSIDGGGVRGLIPAKILETLENYIQKKEGNENARLSDYFDFIAGTSTGGLIATMLATRPSESDPPFSAKEIIDFYYKEAPNIFPDKAHKEFKEPTNLSASAMIKTKMDLIAAESKVLNNKPAARRLGDLIALNEDVVELGDLLIMNKETAGREVLVESVQLYNNMMISLWPWDHLNLESLANHLMDKFKESAMSVANTIVKRFLPKYDVEKLKKAIQRNVGEKRLADTVTNVIIPSYDIKLLQPKVFSTVKAKGDDSENAKLIDVCMSTSAVPLLFPHHTFDINPNKQFYMVDGGVAANNPCLVALSEIAKMSDVKCLKDIECEKLLVLSIGTGSSQRNNNLEVTKQWGPLDWVIGKDGVPIIDIFMTACDDMTDFYLSGFFKGTAFDQNYLRIQTDSLKSSEVSMDHSNEKYLKYLEKIAEELLKKPSCALDLETGFFEPIEGKGTYGEELKSFGDKLIDIKKGRPVNSANVPL